MEKPIRFAFTKDFLNGYGNKINARSNPNGRRKNKIQICQLRKGIFQSGTPAEGSPGQPLRAAKKPPASPLRIPLRSNNSGERRCSPRFADITTLRSKARGDAPRGQARDRRGTGAVSGSFRQRGWSLLRIQVAILEQTRWQPAPRRPESRAQNKNNRPPGTSAPAKHSSNPREVRNRGVTVLSRIGSAGRFLPIQEFYPAESDE
jgi:hypothetical protein